MDETSGQDWSIGKHRGCMVRLCGFVQHLQRGSRRLTATLIQVITTVGKKKHFAWSGHKRYLIEFKILLPNT